MSVYDTIQPRELAEFLREANRLRLAELEASAAAREARMARVVAAVRND